MALSLKNKIVSSSSTLIVLLLVNCGGSKETKTEVIEKNDSASCVKPPVNPNGDSELAVLMRQMRDSTATFKEIIKSGKVPDKFPEVFLKIHTALPTDNETKKPSFDGFATAYLNSLSRLSKSNANDAMVNYNIVVQACENCHLEHCPGPLSAIRKLKL